jgi:hypothetical protein
MFPEEADKRIANPKLTEEQRAKIAKARNCDNSDIDFCEHDGKLVINYCWGNQVGTEFIAEAEYAGTAAQFLTGWFPSSVSADCPFPASEEITGIECTGRHAQYGNADTWYPS